MLSLEEARALILAAMKPLSVEQVPLLRAAGRVLGEELLSPIDLPAFTNSAMDGYAVRASEVAGASSATPVKLRLAGQVAAGETFRTEFPQHGCVRIFTGSVVPNGADAVIMQEDTRPVSPLSEAVQFVEVLDGAKPGENIRHAGEDVAKGTRIASAGERLNSGHLGLLAAVGLEQLPVRRQPIISLLATGSELLEPGAASSAGKIYESNRAMLTPLVAAVGGNTRSFPIVRDSFEETKRALQTAFAESDAVITSGGVSVGEFDFVKKAFEAMGGSLDFWRVAIKPGKPFVFGRFGEKFLFGLPGNPVSAFVTFLLLVRPALLRWQGVENVDLPSFPGILSETLSNMGDRRHFIRVHANEKGEIRSVGNQASHLLRGLGLANGLLDMPPNSRRLAGSTVQVMRVLD